MKKYRTKPWAKGLACGLFVLAMTVSVICLGNVRWLAYHGGRAPGSWWRRRKPSGWKT